MNHWHEMEMVPYNPPNPRWGELRVCLRPPQLVYESARANIQSRLDGAYFWETRSHRKNLAKVWRSGTEVPPDTVFLHDKTLMLLGCDNECPRNAQVLLDGWADSMGRKAPRLTTGNLIGDWPQDFKALFDQPEVRILPAAKPGRRRGRQRH